MKLCIHVRADSEGSLYEKGSDMENGSKEGYSDFCKSCSFKQNCEIFKEGFRFMGPSKIFKKHIERNHEHRHISFNSISNSRRNNNITIHSTKRTVRADKFIESETGSTIRELLEAAFTEEVLRDIYGDDC